MVGLETETRVGWSKKVDDPRGLFRLPYSQFPWSGTLSTEKNRDASPPVTCVPVFFLY